MPPLSAEATCALDSAARHVAAARPDSAHPEVRTEHLLFVLALDPGGRARRVLNDLGTDIAAIKRELECYVTGKPRRRSSRWKRPAAGAGRVCSFCGRSEKVAGRLISGPGVHICGPCVALAGDILRSEGG
jgi:ATP-dependent Clp protease ATP-binding subunit ClpA